MPELRMNKDDYKILAQAGLTLEQRPEGLTLCKGELSMCGDFTHMIPRLTPNRLNGEMLVRAAKIKGIEHPTLFDATAGMGEDSLLLAAAGFDVQLCEYDPIIFALLSDTVERAKQDPDLMHAVARMHLKHGDSIEMMHNMAQPVDVILLDPMFPERKKSGLIKKKFQLLQQLERPCDNETELLEAAIAANPRRIVIKRPLKGPYLDGRKPSYSMKGKAIRYDCIVLH